MDKAELKKNYEDAVKAYCDEFSEKNGLEIDSWVGDDIGTICNVSDMYLSFLDIKYCVDNDVSFDILSEWYYFVLENEKYRINLDAYFRLRRDYIYQKGFGKNDFEKELKIILKRE